MVATLLVDTTWLYIILALLVSLSKRARECLKEFSRWKVGNVLAPFLFKVSLTRLFYLLKILYNIIFSFWRFTNWLYNKSWNWNSIFSFFQVWTNIFWIIWQHKKKYDIRLIHFTLKDIEQINCQFVDIFLCALGFCFRGDLNVVTMEIIKIVTTIKRCNNLNRL